MFPSPARTGPVPPQQRCPIRSTIRPTISSGPIILAIALGLATAPQFTQAAHLVETWPFIGALLFKLVPIVILSFAFGLLYLLMPNTCVTSQAALAGGVVGGGAGQ